MVAPEITQYIEQFWARRAKEVRLYTLVQVSANLVYMLSEIFIFPLTSRYLIVCCVNAVVLAGIVLTLIYTFWHEEANYLIRYMHFLMCMRLMLDTMDFGGVKDLMLPLKFEYLTFINIAGFGYLCSMHFKHFSQEKRRHKLLAATLVGAFSALSFQQFLFELMKDFNHFIMISVCSVQFLSCLGFEMNTLFQFEVLSQIHENFEQQKMFKFMLDNFNESIAIMSSTQGRLLYRNKMFHRQIMQGVAEARPSDFSHFMRFRYPKRCIEVMADRMAEAFARMFNRPARRSSLLEKPSDNEEDIELHAAHLPEWMRTKLFRFYRTIDPEEHSLLDEGSQKVVMKDNELQRVKELSFKDIISEGDRFNNEILVKIKQPIRKSKSSKALHLAMNLNSLSSTKMNPRTSDPDINDKSPNDGSSDSQDSEGRDYVQVKFSTLSLEETDMTMLQVIEVTDTIQINKAKERSELLSLINATVSHEMRNPLNSIIAQNVEKESLYAEIESIVAECAHCNSESGSKVSGLRNIIDRLKEGLKVQESSASLMSFLVQDLLDYAQIKSGKFRKNIEVFDVREAVEQVMQMQRKKAAEQKLQFFADYDAIGDAEICADKKRLMQVLLNLQSNALKFTQEGQVSIRIRQFQKPSLDRRSMVSMLEVSVRDTGVGIPYQDQDKLFKLFGFVKSTQSLNTNGIGLGLVISEQITKKFGGSIEFESIPVPAENHGSVFTFTFQLENPSSLLAMKTFKSGSAQLNALELVHLWRPAICPKFDSSEFMVKDEACDSDLSRIENEEISNQIHSFEPSGTNQSNTPIVDQPKFNSVWNRKTEERRVLVVDDQAFNIDALKIVLSYKLGVDQGLIDSEMSGIEAVRTVIQDFQAHGASSYGLILMDCNMPHMDGYEATERIREFLFFEGGITLKNQPVISAVTGQSEEQYVKRCLRSGMNQVISKPVEFKCLREAALAGGVIQA